MSIEEHKIHFVKWAEPLIAIVRMAIKPDGPFVDLGMRCVRGTTDERDGSEVYHVFIYPQPSEIRGGSLDGGRRVSGFSLNISRICEAFEEVKSVAWNAPARYTGRLDGPEVRVHGIFAGRTVLLRVFDLPPPDEPCLFVLDMKTGETHRRCAL